MNGYDEAFAELIALIQDNYDQLNELVSANSKSVVRAQASKLAANNQQLDGKLAALWAGILELATHRNELARNGEARLEAQIVRNIEYALNVEHEEARIIYQYITGNLPDYVWGQFDRDAKTALRQIADDVSRDREEQGSEVA